MKGKTYTKIKAVLALATAASFIFTRHRHVALVPHGKDGGGRAVWRRLPRLQVTQVGHTGHNEGLPHSAQDGAPSTLSSISAEFRASLLD